MKTAVVAYGAAIHQASPHPAGLRLTDGRVLGEDAVGRNLWDIEDDELLAAIERFRQDLSQCEVGVDDPTYDLYQEAVPK